MRINLVFPLAIACVTPVAMLAAPSANAQALPPMPALPTVQEIVAPYAGLLPLPVQQALGVAPAAPQFGDIAATNGPGAILASVNAWRAANGRAPLADDAGLAQTAQGWAATIGAENVVEHNQAFLRASGGQENIVVAPASCDARCLVDLWEHSPDHNETMLDPTLSHSGIGIAQNHDGMSVVVQDFS